MQNETRLSLAMLVIMLLVMLSIVMLGIEEYMQIAYYTKLIRCSNIYISLIIIIRIALI